MDKKGESFSIFGVIAIVIAVVLIIAFVPVIVNTTADADASVLGCNDPATPILNTSLSLCTNASGVSVINATPTNDGLTATESTLMALVPLFLVIGLVLIVAIKSGLFRKK